MYHLAAFSASVAFGAVDAPLSLVNDQLLVANAAGQAIVPRDAQVALAYCMGTSLTRAKIVAPSQRRITYPFIRPIVLGVVVPSLPPLADWSEGWSPKLIRNESVTVATTNNLGAGSETHTAFLWLLYGIDNAPVGPMSTVRFTCAVTLVTGAWASGVMTPTETLPFGRYAVVGMNAWGANVAAARLIPTDGGVRPGCLVVPGVGGDDRNWLRNAQLGKLIEFEQTSTPNVEFYGVGAGTTQEVYLDVVQIG